jgi:Flp pilus assembly protein TadD
VLSGRSAYAPSMGVALMIGAALARLAATHARATGLAATRARAAARVAAGCYLGACAALTWSEVRVWRGSESAIDAAAARDPRSYWVPMTRAYRARDDGHTLEALAYFRSAAELLPFDTEMLTDGASLALAHGDTADATRWLRIAVTASPRARRARARLAAVVGARGDSAGSRQLLEEGLRVEPDQRTWAALLARSP